MFLLLPPHTAGPHKEVVEDLSISYLHRPLSSPGSSSSSPPSVPPGSGSQPLDLQTAGQESKPLGRSALSRPGDLVDQEQTMRRYLDWSDCDLVPVLTYVQQDASQVSQQHVLVWMSGRAAQVYSLLDEK